MDRTHSNGSVVVTCGAGFLGSRICRRLEAGGDTVVTLRSKDYGLTDAAAVQRPFKDTAPEVVIHAATVLGGIGANRTNPGRFFYDNLLMGILTREHARLAGVKKVAAVGPICACRKHTPVRSHVLGGRFAADLLSESVDRARSGGNDGDHKSFPL